MKAPILPTLSGNSPAEIRQWAQDLVNALVYELSNITAGAVTNTTYIVPGIIGTTELEDLSVTTGKVALVAIDTAQLANTAVTTAKIADANVSTDKLANLAVDASKLAGATTGSQISVTGIASGVCSTTNTQGLANGDHVRFGSGGTTAGGYYLVSSVVANTSFTIDDATITDTTDVTCYEATEGAITYEKIANLAVGHTAIAAAAIGTAHIANLAVTTALIADLSVVAAKIGSLAVEEAKINSLAVTEAKIGALAVTEAKIGNLAVTAAKIALATITSAQIANATITAAQIANATITYAQIANATITGAKIANATIAAANIANATITATQIADATITNAKIADATIETAKIGLLQVTSATIAELTVGTSKITANAVTTPVAAFTSGGVSCPVNEVTALQSIGITATGSPILLWFSGIALGDDNNGIGSIKFYDGGNLINTVGTFSLANSTGPKLLAASYTDPAPGAGAHTYTVGLHMTGGAGSAATRNMMAMEVKK